jgi:hypothetical protein
MLSLEEISENEQKLYKKNMLHQRFVKSIMIILVVYILFSPSIKRTIDKYKKIKLDTNIILSIIVGIFLFMIN